MSVDLERGDFDTRSIHSKSSIHDQDAVHDIAKIRTSGNNAEWIHIGKQKFLREDLQQAFGGNLNPDKYAAPSSHKFGNPAPLGLSAFALTTFVLSVCNAKAMGITTPNVVVGLAFFYGGFVQFCAGMWEIVLENTFGATALASYGGFWMSYAAIQTDFFGVIAAYEGHEEQLTDALGFYLLAWSIFTYMLCLCTMKSTLAFFLLFFFLANTFLLLSIGAFTGSAGTSQAGGILGIVTAFLGWYNAFSGLANSQNSYITVSALPLPDLSAKRR
ncbi:hypothetical protein BABINDRAFT_162430 [Babjeviella inositovora NRRL Y-12698]|uniref:Uncharacterized protein n=1 Tax=Babjeviella inositovora NRRL Y-12698 TaxID=984486 RepID=A0A1E3QM62_9ASCO|nr:uncharacterized protein BABINDRAFT_162430 [Babjeviella inositovora NRRL Y-12698]ODQ78740.1 hypothetical protein BABINDRAFT_162430 [Babjeviella inositovora NRRL Y-12698]